MFHRHILLRQLIEQLLNQALSELNRFSDKTLNTFKKFTLHCSIMLAELFIKLIERYCLRSRFMNRGNTGRLNIFGAWLVLNIRFIKCLNGTDI